MRRNHFSSLKVTAIALGTSAMVALSGCKIEPPLSPQDPKPPGSSPSPLPGGDPNYSSKCVPPSDFNTKIDTLFTTSWVSSLLISRHPSQGRPGRIGGVQFLIWYLLTTHFNTGKYIYGRKLAFPLRDPRLDNSQFNQARLRVEAMLFDPDQVSWKTLQVGLDGIKGSGVDPSAIEVEELATYEVSPSIELSLGEYLGPDDPSDAGLPPVELSQEFLSNPNATNNKSTRVKIHSLSRVALTLDLKKFSFGASTTADDILRRVADRNGILLVRLKHSRGWLRVVDSALTLSGSSPGNCPEPPPTQDTTAPNMHIETQEVSGRTRNTNQTITFKADEPVAFNCRFDQGSWENCGSETDNRSGSWSGSNLSDGEHQLSIRAQDSAGNTSDILTVQWTVDTTPPTLTFSSITPSENVTSLTNIEVHVNSNETVQLQCSLDGEAFKACSSPATWTDLSDGPHRIEIRATDLVQLQSEPIVHEWTVLSTPPSVMITSLEPEETPTSSQSIQFSLHGAYGTSGFECSLDGAPRTSCTSPVIYENLSDGAHSFEVRAVDSLGRLGEPATYAWTVDTAAPEAFVISTSLIRNPTSSDSIEISFGANESSIFKCALNSGVEEDCQSPASYTALAEGSHRFRLWAIDAAGNRSSAPVEYAWIIDRTPPVAQISSVDPSGAVIGSSSLKLVLQSNETATFECRVDEGEFTGCPPTATFSDLSDGSHTIEVRAIDEALNIGPVVTHSFKVDTISPSVAIESVDPSANMTNSTSRQIHFSSNEDDVTFECELDNSGLAECVSPVTYSGLSEGSHSVRIIARDLAGNITGEPAVDSWMIDLTPPDTTITNVDPTENPTESTSIVFEFTSNETGSTFECQRNSLDFEPCVSPYILNNLTDGTHSFKVRAIDRVGNVDASVASYTWTVDTSPLMIFNVALTNVTQTGALITWTTNRAATSRVIYTEVSTGTVSFTPETPTRQTSHSVQLTGLKPNTIYTIQAISTSASGQEARTSSIAFRTAR